MMALLGIGQTETSFTPLKYYGESASSACKMDNHGLKLIDERTLAVFDLTEREKRMVKSGLVFRMGKTCK